MKITVINGNNRHGSTWHCTDQVLKEMARQTDVQVTEFFLPKDMPHLCAGCFSCFYNGEDTCPHAKAMEPIKEALLSADVLVLTSPVYAMDVSGQMKVFLDHLSFQWMSHRPDPRMFHKVGLIVSTTAGAGLSHTVKTMHNSMKFWGMKRIIPFRMAVSAMKWDDVSDKKRRMICAKAQKTARRIVKEANKASSSNPMLFTRFFFTLMKGMMKGNDWNLRDRGHWEANGWLSGDTPF